MENRTSLTKSNIRVDIVDLRVSEPFYAFNNEEIKKLSYELEILTHKSLNHIFSSAAFRESASE